MCPWVGNAEAQIPAQYNEELSNWKSYSNLQGADLREEEFTNSFFFFFFNRRTLSSNDIYLEAPLIKTR